MQLGETATLNVEISGSAAVVQPDFSALQQDFNLLGTESSTAASIASNGQTAAKLLLAVGLEPKHAGTLTIPALSIAGAQTQPLTLTVTPAPTAAGKAGDDVFLDVTVEPKSPYVQQQVRVTVKLYYTLSLTDGALDEPHGDGLSVRKLGQDVSYTADVEGRRYRVLERHYALSAEKSGTLTLAPIVFRGHAINSNDINSFFSHGRGVVVRAQDETLDVRPRPPTSGTDAWLPAQSLTLTAEGIGANVQTHVGEPLTLTLRLQAQGLGFEQLPELKLPKIDGADVYPDKENTANRDDGTWQYGERTRKFAIVPNRAGTLTIPPLSLAWWTLAEDRAASAELPAVRVNVGPSTNPAPPAVPIAANSTNIQSTVAPRESAAERGDIGYWRMLALGAIGLWVATVLAWLDRALARRRRDAGAASPAPTLPADARASAARKSFESACKRGDAAAAAHALLAWARGEGGTARTLGELPVALGDTAQRAAVNDLQRCLYGADIAGFDGERVAAAFRGGMTVPRNAPTKPASPLPPLYPKAGI
jgi:hypothetical protein